MYYIVLFNPDKETVPFFFKIGSIIKTLSIKSQKILHNAINERWFFGKIAGSPAKWKKIIGVGIVNIIIGRTSIFLIEKISIKIPKDINPASIE